MWVFHHVWEGAARGDARVKSCAAEAGLGVWGPSLPEGLVQIVSRSLISGNGDKLRNLAQCEGNGTRKRTGIAGTNAGLATGIWGKAVLASKESCGLVASQ